MTEHKLINHNNSSKDLLFWIKHYLVYKLSTLDKNKIKADFDITLYFQQIKKSESIEDISRIAKEIKKNLGTFYNIVIGIIKFYEFIEKMEPEKITDITNSIFYHDFIGKELDKTTKGTRVGYKSAVKQLFDFIELYNNYYEDGRPFLFRLTRDSENKSIPSYHLKQYRKVPIYLTMEELQKLNSGIMTCTNFLKSNYDFQRAKDVLIMKILIYSGITPSELAELKLSDITEVEVKNKKYLQLDIKDSNLSDRKIPISNKNIIRYYNSYLKVREPQEHDYLFYDKADTNRKVRTQYILLVVKKFFECSKIEKLKITAEVIRNTFGITLYNLGSPELYIKELMGYKTIQMLRELVKYGDKHLPKVSEVFNYIDKM